MEASVLRSSHDLRWRTTQRVVHWLKSGHNVLVSGGPLLGKKTLFQGIPTSLRARIKLVDPLQPPNPESKWVPLAPLPRHMLPQDVSDLDWSLTVGHPYLLAAHAAHRLPEARVDLHARMNLFRPSLGHLWNVIEFARSFVGSPHERYQALRADVSKDELSLLVRLGALNRAVYGDRAGIEVVPFIEDTQPSAG